MASDIQIPLDGASIPAYYTTPDVPSKYPALILIHEIWGLTNHIKSVADRLQSRGYATLAPNLFAQMSMPEKIDQQLLEKMRTPETRDEAQKKMMEATAPANSPQFAQKTIEKLKASFSYLQKQEREYW